MVRAYRISHYLKHPILCFKLEVVRRVQRFIQRGQRGWSNQDVWSFDTYLARVIAEGLEYLRDGYSYPMGMTEHEWDDILREMARGFRNYVDGKFEWGPGEAQETGMADVNRSLKLFKKYFSNLWD